MMLSRYISLGLAVALILYASWGVALFHNVHHIHH
jgi:hypothetical protein